MIAKKLGLAGGLDGAELLTAVREGIEANPCWLLVLDNADNLRLFGVGGRQSQTGDKAVSLGIFVPRGPVGTVLWTSRDKRIGGTLVGAPQAINVTRMTDSEAMTLLETVGNRKMGEGEREDAVQLLSELDWLPLAVSQAAAYMRRMSVTPGEFLSKLASRRKRWKVLKETGFDRHRRPGLPNSVLETWDISMEQIRQDNQMAYDILYVLAFLDSQNIPLELMKKAAELCNKMPTGDRQGPRSSSSGSDSDDDDDVLHAVVRLQEFSFLHLRASEDIGRVYEMHKLVQEATRYALRRRDTPKDEVHFSKLALRVVTDLFPERRRELWEECERYVVHAQRAAEWAGLCEGEKDASELLTQVSGYLFDRGRWRDREPVDKRAYKFRQKKLGGEHPSTLQSMSRLATTYLEQGRYEEAEKIGVEVLALQRDVLGTRHPDTITSMGNLATTYHKQGRYEEAEKIGVEVLALRRDVLGTRHPDTITSIGNLATTYYGQARYEEAEKIEVEVLALQRDVLGTRHPDTIQSMASLASTYYGQARYEEAEKIEVEVLALQRDVLGTGHPEIIWSMQNLAITWYERQRHSEAIAMMEDCFQLFGEISGANHPWTQGCLNILESWKARA